jgi:hypothetical protein
MREPSPLLFFTMEPKDRGLASPPEWVILSFSVSGSTVFPSQLALIEAIITLQACYPLIGASVTHNSIFFIRTAGEALMLL